jgi:hypothetical protein
MSPDLNVHRIFVPFTVYPIAPTGAQNAPGWTACGALLGVGFGFGAGFFVVGAGAGLRVVAAGAGLCVTGAAGAVVVGGGARAITVAVVATLAGLAVTAAVLGSAAAVVARAIAARVGAAALGVCAGGATSEPMMVRIAHSAVRQAATIPKIAHRPMRCFGGAGGLAGGGDGCCGVVTGSTLAAPAVAVDGLFAFLPAPLGCFSRY